MPMKGRSGGASKKSGRRSGRPRRRAGAKRRGASAVNIALAGLAHEIRTPLTGILALAELLSASDLPDRERRWAAALKGSAEHLARLSTLVVDMAKAETAGLVLRQEPFSPRDLVSSVGAALVARAEAKGLRARVSLAGDLPRAALGDEVRLRGALENLVDNAIKFTERGAVTLRVSAARARGGRIRLRFNLTDTGIGISRADLKRLFRPFTQANEEVARRFGGAGLGLAFVKQIAAAMGGRLDVTSSPGRGSSFRLEVLLAKAPRPPAARRASGRARAGLRILCVEDNPYGRVVLAAVLRELGHRASFVGSGRQAVAAVRRGGYDAVLMDVALAGLDGVAATRRIRKLRGAAGRVPIIGISGRTEARDEAEAHAAGMDAYLRKPVSPAALNETLGTLLARRRS